MKYEDQVERNRQIMELALKGMSAGKIALKYGMDRTNVLRVIKRRGKVGGDRGQRSRELNALIVKLRRQGYTLRRIAAMVGVMYQRVGQVLSSEFKRPEDGVSARVASQGGI